MRVCVVGGTGTIGSAVAAALEPRHQVVRVGHERGDRRVDLASKASIADLFAGTGPIDAVVSAAGLASFGALEELGDEDFRLGLENKLMGQINLVRVGVEHLADGGSFTLTSGVLSREPTPGSAAVSPVNAGVEAFARAAALELPRGLRVNVVSPPWVAETLEEMGRDPSDGMPAADVARAYVESVEGDMDGQVLDARAFA
jgi:NAD(P)-dependent dehydrogenase (short-subunit alcohol dehydrogenase family)